jgi:aspartyl-tRNA(Asn)/glutamyl-tRNA(Gln) amidotransferase subunit C
MSITNADVEKIAKLARIRIDDNAIVEVSQRLGNILAMADRLQAVDTTGITPMANPLEQTLRLSAKDKTQRLRTDVVTEPVGDAAVKARDAFLAIAPSSADGLYLVPKVIE